MKYLKLYEEFKEESIDNYNWKYLFQDLMDDNIWVSPTGHYSDGSFEFAISFDNYNCLSYHYNTKAYKSFTNFNKRFNSVEYLKEFAEVLINRVESVGGIIYIRNGSSDKLSLRVWISTNVLEKNTSESYILEKYTGKVGEEVPPKILYTWVASNYLTKLPMMAIKEIFTWDYIYKSKYSMSFYNKPKGWDFTTDGTIRISDHWNYIAQGKMHSKTIQGGYGQNCWAKGVWDESVQKYDIVEKYNTSVNKNEYEAWKEEYLSNHKFNTKPSNAVIEFSRFLSKSVDDGKVYYDDGVISGKVVSFKSWTLDVVDANDQKTRIKEYYKKKYKLIIDGVEYTQSEISLKMGKSPY